MNYDPALAGSVSSPNVATQQYDYSSAIDPALESAAPASASGIRYTPHPGMLSSYYTTRDIMKWTPRTVRSAQQFTDSAYLPHLTFSNITFANIY